MISLLCTLKKLFAGPLMIMGKPLDYSLWLLVSLLVSVWSDSPLDLKVSFIICDLKFITGLMNILRSNGDTTSMLLMVWQVQSLFA